MEQRVGIVPCADTACAAHFQGGEWMKAGGNALQDSYPLRYRI